MKVASEAQLTQNNRLVNNTAQQTSPSKSDDWMK